MVRWPLLLVTVLVWQVESAIDFYLPRMKILMNFVPIVLVSHAVLVIVVNIVMIGLTNDGRG